MLVRRRKSRWAGTKKGEQEFIFAAQNLSIQSGAILPQHLDTQAGI